MDTFIQQLIIDQNRTKSCGQFCGATYQIVQDSARPHKSQQDLQATKKGGRRIITHGCRWQTRVPRGSSSMTQPKRVESLTQMMTSIPSQQAPSIDRSHASNASWHTMAGSKTRNNSISTSDTDINSTVAPPRRPSRSLSPTQCLTRLAEESLRSMRRQQPISGRSSSMRTVLGSLAPSPAYRGSGTTHAHVLASPPPRSSPVLRLTKRATNRNQLLL